MLNYWPESLSLPKVQGFQLVQFLPDGETQFGFTEEQVSKWRFWFCEAGFIIQEHLWGFNRTPANLYLFFMKGLMWNKDLSVLESSFSQLLPWRQFLFILPLRKNWLKIYT